MSRKKEPPCDMRVIIGGSFSAVSFVILFCGTFSAERLSSGERKGG